MNVRTHCISSVLFCWAVAVTALGASRTPIDGSTLKTCESFSGKWQLKCELIFFSESAPHRQLPLQMMEQYDVEQKGCTEIAIGGDHTRSYLIDKKNYYNDPKMQKKTDAWMSYWLRNAKTLRVLEYEHSAKRNRVFYFDVVAGVKTMRAYISGRSSNGVIPAVDRAVSGEGVMYPASDSYIEYGILCRSEKVMNLAGEPSSDTLDF